MHPNNQAINNPDSADHFKSDQTQNEYSPFPKITYSTDNFSDEPAETETSKEQQKYRPVHLRLNDTGDHSDHRYHWYQPASENEIPS
jgi:hypothetical protein